MPNVWHMCVVSLSCQVLSKTHGSVRFLFSPSISASLMQDIRVSEKQKDKKRCLMMDNMSPTIFTRTWPLQRSQSFVVERSHVMFGTYSAMPNGLCFLQHCKEARAHASVLILTFDEILSSTLFWNLPIMQNEISNFVYHKLRFLVFDLWFTRTFVATPLTIMTRDSIATNNGSSLSQLS